MGNTIDANSVIIYLATFALSTFFAFLSERSFLFMRKEQRIKNTRLKFSFLCGLLFSCLAIFVVCFLAAIRSDTVGVDVKLYVISNWEIAEWQNNIHDYLESTNDQIETGFALLIYVCTRFFKSQRLLFFLIEFLIVAPIYVCLYLNRCRFSMTMGFAVFLFLFYNYSLCVMRQGIAMAFILLAYELAMRRHYVAGVFLVVLATFFHNSVFLMTPLFLMLMLVEKSKYKNKIYILMVALLAFVFVIYRLFALILSNVLQVVGLPRYAYYVKQYLKAGFVWSDIPTTDFAIKTLIVFILIAAYFWIQKSQKSTYIKKRTYIEQWMPFVLLGRYFTLFGANFYESMRLAFYFDFFLILFIPATIKVCFNRKFGGRYAVYALVCFLMLLYWIYFIMYVGAYETNIYTTS